MGVWPPAENAFFLGGSEASGPDPRQLTPTVFTRPQRESFKGRDAMLDA